ncbi:MAG: cupin domain-containing protein [Gammaproteobacteria bacterium]
MNAQALIKKLQLQPHPEGGWFREIHRSVDQVTTPRGARSALTTIYYLLERNQLSRWHVVRSDEIWHFYAGAPLELIVYDPATRICRPAVLAAPTEEREPVGIVRAGEWQASRSLGDYSLVGCNVGPGFEFEDFQFVTALPYHAEHFNDELAGYRSLL